MTSRSVSSVSTEGRTRSTIERRLRESVVAFPKSSSSVAAIAPHWEWPSTTTSRVPNRSAANSTLPICDGATTLPATRMTNRSPSPWSNTISAGTRESEQPRMMAEGSWPATSSARRIRLERPSTLVVPETKRRLPSCRRCSASRAGTVNASPVPAPVVDELRLFRQPHDLADRVQRGAEALALHRLDVVAHGVECEHAAAERLQALLGGRIVGQAGQLGQEPAEVRPRLVEDVGVAVVEVVGPAEGFELCLAHTPSLARICMIPSRWAKSAFGRLSVQHGGGL